MAKPKTVTQTLKRWVIVVALMLPYMAAIGLPASYERSLANTLVSEGYDKYTNISGDPGGPTKYGITIHDVRHYLNPDATAQDVRNLELSDAKLIYRSHYWDTVKGDDLPAGLDYSVFDFSVNAGARRALSTLNGCYAEFEKTETVKLIKCVNDERMRFQMNLPSRFNKFKRGWRNRILSVRQISLEMAGVKSPKATLSIDLHAIPRIGLGKAYLEEPNAVH